MIYYYNQTHFTLSQFELPPKEKKLSEHHGIILGAREKP